MAVDVAKKNYSLEIHANKEQAYYLLRSYLPQKLDHPQVSDWCLSQIRI